MTLLSNRKIIRLTIEYDDSSVEMVYFKPQKPARYSVRTNYTGTKKDIVHFTNHEISWVEPVLTEPVPDKESET